MAIFVMGSYRLATTVPGSSQQFAAVLAVVQVADLCFSAAHEAALNYVTPALPLTRFRKRRWLFGVLMAS